MPFGVLRYIGIMAADPPLPRSLVEEELAALVESDSLRRAPSHLRLLRYLVERRLAGDEESLRETAIALEVFRRDPATYDPQTDPIVRVTARRLRERLDAHYARFVNPPKVRIVLPRGRYAPDFIALGPAARPRLGIAVLRTRNQTGDEALGAWCDAFAEQLSDRLARAGLPRVIARGSVSAAEARTRDPVELGAQLQVPWLLEATLSSERATELRLSVRLVHTAEASVRWVETGLASAGELYRLADRVQDTALLRTVQTLPGGTLSPADATAFTGLPDAQRAALDAVRLMLLQRTMAGTDEAIAMVEAVTRSHPGSAEAWALLAAAQYSRLSFMDVEGAPMVARIIDSVDHALALDPDQPVALRTKAIVLGKAMRDTTGARALFERVLRALPNYTSARLNYAEILALDGDFDDARAQLNLALVHDPLSISVRLAQAYCFAYERRYDDSRRAWALCRAGGEASLWVLTGSGMTELVAGNLDAAESLLDEAVSRFPDMPVALIFRACLHAARGDTGRADALERQCLSRFPRYSPGNRARLAGWRRDREGTLRLLTQARDEGDMDFLAATIDPAFDWLAGDEQLERLRHRALFKARRSAGRS